MRRPFFNYQSMNATLIPTIETAVSVLTIHENGVGQMHFKDDIVMEIADQMEHLNGLIEITKKQPTPFIVTTGKRVIFSKEARENAVLLEAMSPVNAMAVIVQNLAYRLVADFYLRFNQPKIPYKVFTDQEKAIDWCKQFVVGDL
jgi:hypothetical protein